MSDACIGVVLYDQIHFLLYPVIHNYHNFYDVTVLLLFNHGIVERLVAIKIMLDVCTVQHRTGYVPVRIGH